MISVYLLLFEIKVGVTWILHKTLFYIDIEWRIIELSPKLKNNPQTKAILHSVEILPRETQNLLNGRTYSIRAICFRTLLTPTEIKELNLIHFNSTKQKGMHSKKRTLKRSVEMWLWYWRRHICISKIFLENLPSDYSKWDYVRFLTFVSC